MKVLYLALQETTEIKITCLSKSCPKWGLSTYMSYRGAQLFEVVGINTETVAQYFTGTPTRVEGVDQWSTYRGYAQIINDQSKRQMTLRGLFAFKTDPGKAIALDEVEPASGIVKRFATGAMSLGSISTEAHTNLALAMNRMGVNFRNCRLAWFQKFLIPLMWLCLSANNALGLIR